MRLSHAWPGNYLHLSAQHRYLDEVILKQVIQWYNSGEQIYLHFDWGQICVLQEEEFPLACKMLAGEHDHIVGSNIPYDDGFEDETLAMEIAAQNHMDAQDSDDDNYSDEMERNNAATVVV